MQQNVRAECPKCSRPLKNFNGHIGYCSQHKWVSHAGLGFEAEAAEQNRQDAALAEQSRLEQERQKQEAKAQEAREQHQSTVRKAIIVVVAIALIAAAVVFFVVRPSLNYGRLNVHKTHFFYLAGGMTSVIPSALLSAVR